MVVGSTLGGYSGIEKSHGGLVGFSQRSSRFVYLEILSACFWIPSFLDRYMGVEIVMDFNNYAYNGHEE